MTITKDDAEGLGRTSVSLSALVGKEFDWEWVVVDASSGMESENLARSAGLPLSYHRQRSRGLYAAMNEGIERSSGERFWFLNGGDELLCPGALVDGLAGQPVSAPELVCFPVRRSFPGIGWSDVEAPEPSLTRMIRNAKFMHQGIVYNRAFFDIYGKYDPQYRIIADLEQVARSWPDKASYVVMGDALAIFGAGGVSTTRPDLMLRDFLKAILSRFARGEFGLALYWIRLLPRICLRVPVQSLKKRSSRIAKLHDRYLRMKFKLHPRFAKEEEGSRK